ncbi:MAG: thioredoxin domain-containing protein [Ignavibacteria bacterium]|nr:thioredoxin domain-containing protein [Ignavibacteria bacterium]
MDRPKAGWNKDQVFVSYRMRQVSVLAAILGAFLLVGGCQASDTGRDGSIDQYVRKMMEEGKRANRLINEKSPYLLQHAFNPVDWYPWGEEAFARARQEEKPIFLSVGYSTCHWCHVMEHESFENDSIAAMMNEYFICIKVDREERPDIDKVYMTALQGMGQGGGWPMSMFLTPDLKPFYGGTYFPPENRYGRIGFPELLNRIHTVWTNQREKIIESSDGLTEYLRQSAAGGEPTALAVGIADSCFRQIEGTYDAEFGGFGAGPKFPRPVVFSFLSRHHIRTGNAKALEIMEKSLMMMARGGVYDHIGGGFHRYSVDGQWRVPHFEKMLYDQAQLAIAYLELYQLTGNDAYATVVHEILEYVIRDMTDPAGGFYSAEDADSPFPENPEEKGEGAFYVWTQDELKSVLTDEEFAAASVYFGIRPDGNALADPQNEFTGKNILFVPESPQTIASRLGITPTELSSRIDQARKKLLTTRDGRPHPHLDDKILTSWNGMMISAFARASRILGEEGYRSAAERSARFIMEKLYDQESGLLMRRFRDGEAAFDANLEDYSLLGQGFLDLYEATFDLDWLDRSIHLAQQVVDRFHDQEGGGFYDTSGNDSTVLVRMKEMYDGAEPTGNSVATGLLLKLADMTDNDHWRGIATESLTAAARVLNQQPSVMPQMVIALDFSVAKMTQILIVGKKDEPGVASFLSAIDKNMLPASLTMLIEDPGPSSLTARFLPFAGKLTRIDNKPTVYLCRDYVCQLPTTEPEVFENLLREGTVAEPNAGGNGR